MTVSWLVVNNRRFNASDNWLVMDDLMWHVMWFIVVSDTVLRLRVVRARVVAVWR
jgi:hypothetical protein